MDMPTTSPPIDKEALRRKYAEERDKRIRADGSDQYVRLESEFAEMAADPYTPVASREPLSDHVNFAFIGGGFAGLVTGARLKEAGIDDVRIVEKGGDFGGTWYWNRYPGAQCDTASMIYMPLLEETGHRPTEKYAHAPEIREHCARIGRQYGLYENALFHTRVTGLEWDDAARLWTVRTDRGDAFTAKYVGLGTGPLHVAKLPNLPGVETFAGKSFHTSRWDYAYTGGDPEGAPMTKLADKRVAVIGTGATAVQCVPRLARDAKELLVFQRTPSSVDRRDNAPIDAEWFEGIAGEGWQRRWQRNFAENMGNAFPTEDLVSDGWTDLAKRMRSNLAGIPVSEWTPQTLMAAFEDADFEKMEQIRRRAEELVDDPDTAENLKAWYRQLCKRPCFHDAYLQAFNEPGVRLIDTGGQGVERITERGVVAGGKEYPVDCIVYASGFEVSADPLARTGFDVAGRGGRMLSEHWDEGMRTLHGLHTHGFPNLFIVQPAHAANFIVNVPHNILDHADTIAAVVGHAEAEGLAEVDATAEAEGAWMDLLATAPERGIGGPDCTPGYYNNEGAGWSKVDSFFTGHPQGALAYWAHIDAWRKSGEFAGLAFA